VRGAIIAGAVASTTAALPVIPAMAQTLSVPGVGNFDVPDLPQPIQNALAQPQVQQAVNQVVNQAPPQYQQAATQVMNQVMHPSVPAPTVAMGATAGQRALDAARTRLGTPYVWGGQAPGGFDCSGLVKWSYAQAGVQMPRTSFEQAHVGAPVSVRDLRPGDVVILNGGGHAALYAGNGRILHASVSGQPVEYGDLHYGEIVTARRL
jgi:cell wall-associated NlpC family hydrolase